MVVYRNILLLAVPPCNMIIIHPQAVFLFFFFCPFFPHHFTLLVTTTPFSTFTSTVFTLSRRSSRIKLAFFVFHPQPSQYTTLLQLIQVSSYLQTILHNDAKAFFRISKFGGTFSSSSYSHIASYCRCCLSAPLGSAFPSIPTSFVACTF